MSSSESNSQASREEVARLRQEIEDLRRAVGASEGLKRSLLAAVPSGVSYLAADGSIVAANDALLKVLGWTRAEFENRNVADFNLTTFWEDGSHCPVEDFPVSKCLETRETQAGVTLKFRRPDGEMVWVFVSAVPVFDAVTGDFQGTVASTLDITAQKEAEIALRKSEESYRKLIEEAPDAIFVHDGKRLRCVNAATVALLGASSAEELRGMPVLDMVAAESREFVAHRVRQIVEQGTTTPLVEVKMRRLDGGITEVEATGMPCVFEGEPGVQVVLRDISERKRTAQTLLEANAELESRVAARTEELSQKNRELEAEVAQRRNAETELQEKQRFLRQMIEVQERERQLVAYEIHDTFVQDVIGALLLVDAFHEVRHGPADRDWREFEETRRLLRKAIGEARRMIGGLRPPIIDDHGIVAGVEFLIGEIESRGLRIEFEHDVPAVKLPPRVTATIFRIVQEALNNLERHSKSDFGKVSLRQIGERVQLSVRDFGVGFDRQVTPTGHYGLQGIRERARIAGGTATIASEPGKGTEIVVDLPIGSD